MEVEQFLARARARTDAALQRHVVPDQGRIAEAIRYVLFPGGKRLRPAVVLASGEVVHLEGEALDKVACAAEFIHTASLVVDDLPSMDDSGERRGRQSLHVAFDEATAILASDALIVEAFRLCGDVPEVVRALAEAVGIEGMVGGQAQDLQLRGESSREEVEQAETLKTAALFRFSAEAPALAVGASPETAAVLAEYGEALGRLFQLTDDLLDLEHEEPSLARLLGREAALESARALCDEACSKTEPFGERAEHLRLLARHVLARTS